MWRGESSRLPLRPLRQGVGTVASESCAPGEPGRPPEDTFLPALTRKLDTRVVDDRAAGLQPTFNGWKDSRRSPPARRESFAPARLFRPLPGECPSTITRWAQPLRS